MQQTAQGYSFYAIDHGHSLNGCTQGEIKWQLENVGDNTKFPISNLNHVSEPQIESFVDLEPMIKCIEELKDSVENIVLNLADAPLMNELQKLTDSEIDDVKDMKSIIKYRDEIKDNLPLFLKAVEYFFSGAAEYTEQMLSWNKVKNQDYVNLMFQCILKRAEDYP